MKDDKFSLKSGIDVTIEAYVTGNPLPGVKWFLDGTSIDQLTPPLKFSQEFKDGVATLRTKHVCLFVCFF